MPKISFTKLSLKPNNDVVNIHFNDQVIEVKQYLPTDKKLDIITNVLELSHDSNNFSNPVKVGVYTALEVVDKYTNISFTDKQKEDVLKLYDLLNSNGVIAAVVNAIPEAEYKELLAGIHDTIESVYKFQNSVLGILDTIGKDYSNLKLDAEGIQKALGDPENLGLLKDIMTKLG